MVNMGFGSFSVGLDWSQYGEKKETLNTTKMTAVKAIANFRVLDASNHSDDIVRFLDGL